MANKPFNHYRCDPIRILNDDDGTETTDSILWFIVLATTTSWAAHISEGIVSQIPNCDPHETHLITQITIGRSDPNPTQRCRRMCEHHHHHHHHPLLVLLLHLQRSSYFSESDQKLLTFPNEKSQWSLSNYISIIVSHPTQGSSFDLFTQTKETDPRVQLTNAPRLTFPYSNRLLHSIRSRFRDFRRRR